MTETSLLIVPGLGGSGAEHWQTLWQARYPHSRRVEQQDWDRPVLAEWVAALDAAVRTAPGPTILVAHSLSCALVAHWAQRGDTRRVTGALLVAPADVESPAHTPEETRCFAPLPLAPLPFPTTVVASSDDPYVPLERARRFARSWRGRLVEIGAAGHINAASGFGPWPAGERCLAELLSARGGAPADRGADR